MAHWRPGPAWFAGNTPKLSRVAQAVAQHPALAPIMDQHFPRRAHVERPTPRSFHPGRERRRQNAGPAPHFSGWWRVLTRCYEALAHWECRMDLANSALLPVDMQQAFDGPGWPRRWNRDLDANALRLLAAWRRTGRPIVHVRHDSAEPGSTLRPGEPGHAFRAGFEPGPGEPLVAKSVNAAFIGTDLDLRLRRLGIGTLVTFGISTDMCVSTTVRTGANLGYRMILVEDACDCFDLPDRNGRTIAAEDVHAAHVATLAFEFATVVTTCAAISSLSADNGGPTRA